MSRENFVETALASGIPKETAHVLYDAFRDASEHGWSEYAREWCGNASLLITRALESPQKMQAVCSYFFASDGGRYQEGLKHLDPEVRQLAENVLATGWEAESEDDLGPPYLLKAGNSSYSDAGYLQGPRSPQDVKKLGYGFTNNPKEAWSFPSRKQALAKARIVDQHMGWGSCMLPKSAAENHERV